MKPAADSPEVICVRHGRQFHVSGSNYGLPNDEREFNRLNDQFQALKMVLGSNYTAPLPQLNSGEGPKDILDVASGSGIWVIEIAHEFPQAQVIEIDISKPGFFGQGVPNNASFVIADVTKRFPFEDASFDVVQMRIVPSIGGRALIYREIHRVLRPGQIYVSSACVLAKRRFGQRVLSSRARGGHVHKKDENEPSLDRNEKPEYWSIASRIAPAIRGAPSMWMSVHEKTIGIPIGVWSSVGQEAGRLMKRQTVELYNGFRPNFIDIGGMTGDEVDEIIARLADELEDGPKWQLETLYNFVWAAKA